MDDKVAQQPTFAWAGTNKQGKVIKGEMQGKSAALVRAELRRQGLTPKKVTKKSTPLLAKRKQKITPKDIAILSRQISTMMEAGVPLVQTFTIIANGAENKSVRALVIDIRNSISSGLTFATALERHPLYFDDLFISLVASGEESGALEIMLDKLATYKEKTEAIKGKVKKALFYPTAIIAMAFIVTAILMIFVIPEFEKLFSGFGGNLPGLTMVVIMVSHGFVDYWWLIFGSLYGAIKGIMEFKRRSRSFTQKIEQFSLKIPVIGVIQNKAAIARFSRTLATMITSGVPMVEALDSVSKATGNIVYEKATIGVRDEVKVGIQLNVALRNAVIFPSMVVQMVAIGEESGSMEKMLTKVANVYEEEVDNLVDAMSSLLEPLIMAVLGVIIGTLVIAMYLPIFKLSSIV